MDHQTQMVTVSLQVFGLLDMHEQLDGRMQALQDVFSNTNSGSLLRVRHGRSLFGRSIADVMSGVRV